MGYALTYRLLRLRASDHSRREHQSENRCPSESPKIRSGSIRVSCAALPRLAFLKAVSLSRNEIAMVLGNAQSALNPKKVIAFTALGVDALDRLSICSALLSVGVPVGPPVRATKAARWAVDVVQVRLLVLQRALPLKSVLLRRPPSTSILFPIATHKFPSVVSRILALGLRVIAQGLLQSVSQRSTAVTHWRTKGESSTG